MSGLRKNIATDFHLLWREPTGNPAFAIFTRALGGKFHPATDPDRRMGLLHWLGVDLGIFEFDEFPFVGSQGLGPYGFHRFDILVGSVTAPLIRDAKHAEFVRFAGGLGTESDTDQQTTVGEPIQRRILFGRVNRIAAGHHQTSDPESNLFRLRRQVRQYRGGFKEICFLCVGESLGCTGGYVVAVHFRAPHHVVVHPHRIESQFFSCLGGLDNIFNAGKRARIRYPHAERNIMHDSLLLFFRDFDLVIL